MRTTIRLNDTLLKRAKKAALDRNVSLTRLIEEALREKLAPQNRNQRSRSVRLVVFEGKGLRAGVDLDDSASLLDALDA